MGRLPLLDRDQAPQASRAWYRDDGSASALTRSLATAPELLETMMPFLGYVMGETSVDLPTKELVVLRVSQLNGCRYCLAAHRPLALEAGLPPEGVEAACAERPIEDLPARERAIVEWVDRLTLDPAGVDDECVAAALDHLRDDQLVELTVLAGTIGMLNRYCTAFDIPPPV